MPPPAASEFHRRTRAARKILGVDLGFLGDTLHSVPALWEIRQHYPQAELHVLTSPVGSQVVALAPCVDRTWTLLLDPATRSVAQHWEILRGLRREGFDAAFNFGGQDRAIIVTALSGARRRVAHEGGHRHFWNRWLVPDWVPRQNPDLPVFEQRRQFLAGCGFTLQPPRFELRVPPALAQWASATVPAADFHLSVNSANPMKEWPLANFAGLLKSLFQDRPALRVVASSGTKPREVERLAAVAAAVADPRLQVLPPDLSIPQLAAVLQRCRLHVGPDSGVMHLALALGLPTVSFFREQPGYLGWLPRGARHRTFIVPCTCVDHKTSPCEPTGQAACIARILPAEMRAAIEVQLDSASASS